MPPTCRGHPIAWSRVQPQAVLPALHDRHVSAGAKFAEFAGWSMPLEYQGVVTEHTAVRSAVGVFDVSHLGTLTVRGPSAVLNEVLSNDLTRITDGQAQYTLLLTDDGGIVDDLIAYQVGGDEFILVPNAAIARRWPMRWQGRSRVTDVTRQTAIIAVQGPASDALVAPLGVPDLDYMSFATARIAGSGTVCRTGYPGNGAWRSWSRQMRPGWSGTRSLPRAPCPAGWGPATRCAPRWATRYTVTNCHRRCLRAGPRWGGLWLQTKVRSTAAMPTL